MTGVFIRKGRDTKDVPAQRKGRVGTQRVGGHLQAKERSLRSNHACQSLGLGLGLQNRENIYVVEPTQFVIFFYASPSRIIQRVSTFGT